ncbi:MAG: heavy-metal-associated domain-containing protein [Cellulomonadaceae bacterium]
MTTTEYTVTGMSCGHCESAVRTEVEKLPGIAAVAVSAETGLLSIESAAPLDDAQVLAAVDEAGYEATRS